MKKPVYRTVLIPENAPASKMWYLTYTTSVPIIQNNGSTLWITKMNDK